MNQPYDQAQQEHDPRHARIESLLTEGAQALSQDVPAGLHGRILAALDASEPSESAKPAPSSVTPSRRKEVRRLPRLAPLAIAAAAALVAWLVLRPQGPVPASADAPGVVDPATLALDGSPEASEVTQAMEPEARRTPRLSRDLVALTRDLVVSPMLSFPATDDLSLEREARNVLRDTERVGRELVNRLPKPFRTAFAKL